MQHKNLSAIVVGAGALGNGVCQALGLLGVGSVMVVDGDRVVPRNLESCTMLRGGGSVGEAKARALTAEARRLFPGTRWHALECWFTEVGFGDLAGADLVFSCVDNEVARLEIAVACMRLGLALMDGGIAEEHQPRGRLTWFPSASAACFACLLPMARVSRLLQGADLMGASCSAKELRDGVTGTGSSSLGLIVGAWQAELGLRIASEVAAGDVEAGTVTRSWRLQFSGECRVDSDVAERRPDCPFHEREGASDRVRGPGRPGAAVKEWMAAKGISGIRLDWPLCVTARCAHCGERCRPFRYLSVVRWRLVCVSCGKAPLIPVSSVRTLRATQEFAEKSFEFLGLSPNHWYRW